MNLNFCSISHVLRVNHFFYGMPVVVSSNASVFFVTGPSGIPVYERQYRIPNFLFFRSHSGTYNTVSKGVDLIISPFHKIGCTAGVVYWKRMKELSVYTGYLF